MSDIKGDAAATHNKFGLDLGMDFSYVLSISGFGESIGTNLIQAVSKDGKPAMVNFVANSNAIPNDITATRLIVKDHTEWIEWFEQAASGDTEGAKKDGSIFFYDAKGDSAILTFTFMGAVPNKYSIAGTDANSSSHTTEEITFSLEELKKG
jgi:phage tail-like protein